MTTEQFHNLFPSADRGLTPWNKGFNKNSHLSLARLARKLKKQKRWNFTNWQRNRKKTSYKMLEKDNRLSELIGIILGDGCLEKFPRTERLRIVCNSNDFEYVNRINSLIESIFNKSPQVYNRKNERAIDISFYQCKLSKRLGIPLGNKIENNVSVPAWVKQKKSYIITCLKGLFETDGCYQEDRDNYTKFIEFKNQCSQLRSDVYNLVLKLNYHPQLGSNYVRLARKKEVDDFIRLINFRNN